MAGEGPRDCAGGVGGTSRRAGPYLGRAVRPELVPAGALPSAFLPRPAASCTLPRPPAPLVAAAHLELVRGRLHQSRHIWSPRGGAQGSGGEGARQDRAGRSLPASGRGEAEGGGRRRRCGGLAGSPAREHPRGGGARGPAASQDEGVGPAGSRGAGLRGRGALALGAAWRGPGARRWGAASIPGAERPQGRDGQGESGRLQWPGLGRRQEARSSASGWRTLLFEITRGGQRGGLQTERPQGLFLPSMGPGALLSLLQPTPVVPSFIPFGAGSSKALAALPILS